MVILGIETSCDETACAILEFKENKMAVLANTVSSQIKLHARWGGVVPNLAAREHLANIGPVIAECLQEAGKNQSQIDLIAVTSGPGLIPALLIGTTTAKTLSYLWKKPLIGIHHIEGHIYANFIEKEIRLNSKLQISNSKETTNAAIKFPALCLVVSGGHTQLILMRNHLEYEIVGQTLDDAAGEAFDKVARILDLGYPGGPAVALGAKESSGPYKYLKKKLPRPMINSGDLNFSFSGLKTAVLYLVRDQKDLLGNQVFLAELCREFQQAVIDVLVRKTLVAARKFNPRTIMLAGGVSANEELRAQLKKTVKEKLKNVNYLTPDMAYSVDNAAMIAAAAHWRYSLSKDKNKFLNNWATLKTGANLKINENE